MFKRRNMKQSPEQRPLTAEEKRRLRRKRAQRRTLMRMVLLVALCAVVIVVMANWDSLAPDRLFSAAENLLGIGTGSYPVDLSGTGVYWLERAQNYSAVLTDSHLIYLNRTGAEVSRFSLAYPTALMRTAGQYVLVGEQGGRRIHLSTRNKVLLEMDAEYDIFNVAVNKQGTIAVLTDGPQGYAVQLNVYNKSGRLLYTRNRNHTVTQVSLSADGTQVALLSVAAKNGNLNASLDVFSLKTSSPDALCSYELEDDLLYQIVYMDNGWVAAFSDSSAVMLDTSDGMATVYAPDGVQLLGYAVTEKGLAVAVRSYGTTGDGQVHVVNTKGDLLAQMDFTGEFRHLSGHNGKYALLTDSMVYKITNDGVQGSAATAADGRQVLLDEDMAVVLGLNRITAHNFE